MATFASCWPAMYWAGVRGESGEYIGMSRPRFGAFVLMVADVSLLAALPLICRWLAARRHRNRHESSRGAAGRLPRSRSNTSPFAAVHPRRFRGDPGPRERSACDGWVIGVWARPVPTGRERSTEV